MNRWKTVLIGAGKMGKKHLRVLARQVIAREGAWSTAVTRGRPGAGASP